MIEYIHTQLSIWGRWSAMGAKKDIGYPSVCPMFKDVRHGGGFGSAPPPGVGMVADLDNILSTDAAVQRLGRDQKSLVVEYYVVGGTGEEVARRFGIARRTLYDRLTSVQQSLLGHLNDLAAEC